jgi:ferredoxin
MPRVTIDNRTVEVPAGATVLQAARALGIAIPTLCHREGMAPLTSCMVCLVKVEGRAAMVPSCAAAAEEGMVVHSETPEVLAARKAALELLLSDHLGDCEGPCHSVCPAHMNIPRMIRQIKAGQMREAVATVKRDIALPAVLGRICPAPCEKGCRRAAKDSPVGICLLKRYAADVDLASTSPYLPPCKPTSDKKVAVVGAGPAGLAAAYHLLRAGHACTVFDANELPGGMLRYGVPESRLPRAVLDAEIEVIRRMGAAFRCGVRVGKDVSLDELRKDFAAVAVATGAMPLPVRGEEHEPVPHAHPPQTACEHGTPGIAFDWALGLRAGARGIEVDHATLAASVPGVFAGGEAVGHQAGPAGSHRMAVRAEAGGKGMAASIDQLLSGRPVTGLHRPFTVHIGSLQEGEIDLFMPGASPAPRTCPRIDDAAHAGAAPPSLTAEAAVTEASRCLHCDCRKADNCKLRDHSQAYQAHGARFRSGHRRTFAQLADHPRVIYESGKCIACGLCIAIAQKWQEPLGLTFIGRGFDVRVAVPFGKGLAEALQKAADECVAACPTGALALRDC